MKQNKNEAKQAKWNKTELNNCKTTRYDKYEGIIFSTKINNFRMITFKVQFYSVKQVQKEVAKNIKNLLTSNLQKIIENKSPNKCFQKLFLKPVFLNHIFPLTFSIIFSDLKIRGKFRLVIRKCYRYLRAWLYHNWYTLYHLLFIIILPPWSPTKRYLLWCFLHVCFVQVTTCSAPEALTRLGAHTFLLVSHLLGSQNKFQ